MIVWCFGNHVRFIVSHVLKVVCKALIPAIAAYFVHVDNGLAIVEDCLEPGCVGLSLLLQNVGRVPRRTERLLGELVLHFVRFVHVGQSLGRNENAVIFLNQRSSLAHSKVCVLREALLAHQVLF